MFHLFAPFPSGESAGIINEEHVTIEGTVFDIACSANGIMLTQPDSGPQWWLRCTMTSPQAAAAIVHFALKESLQGATADTLAHMGWVRCPKDIMSKAPLPCLIGPDPELLVCWFFSFMVCGGDVSGMSHVEMAHKHMDMMQRRNTYLQGLRDKALAGLEALDSVPDIMAKRHTSDPGMN